MINNDVIGIIIFYLHKNDINDVTKAIKKYVEEYTPTNCYIEKFLQYCNSNWYRNKYIGTFGHRMIYLSIKPSLYFMYDKSSGVYNLSQLSIINGSIYLFAGDKLELIEQYGYDMKTWRDIYNYIKNKYGNF